MAYLHKYTYLAHHFGFLTFQFSKSYEFILYGFFLEQIVVLILIRVIL